MLNEGRATRRRDAVRGARSVVAAAAVPRTTLVATAGTMSRTIVVVAVAAGTVSRPIVMVAVAAGAVSRAMVVAATTGIIARTILATPSGALIGAAVSRPLLRTALTSSP